MKPGGRKAANALWAEGAEQETTVQIEEVDEAALSSEGLFTACSFFTSFLPTFHNASAETSANATEARDMAPILDSGATHCLLPLSWLSDEDAEQAKRIHLRVASGDQVRALLFNNIIYAKSVTRPLVSIGQLKAMLDLRFVWDDGPPILLFCSSGKKHILLQARVMHHLPVITSDELTALLAAIHLFTTTGALLDDKGWSDQLGKDFKVYGDTCHDSYPPDLPSNEDDQHENDASRAERYNASTATPPSGNLNDGVVSFRLEDQDASTEPEYPVPMEAMHASMQVEEAKRVIMEHPLPGHDREPT